MFTYATEFDCPHCKLMLVRDESVIVNGILATVNEDGDIVEQGTEDTYLCLSDKSPTVRCAHCKKDLPIDTNPEE